MDNQNEIDRAKKLGEYLASLRESSEKSVFKTASYLGISPEELLSFENGDSSPSLPQLESLALFYRVPVSDLLQAEQLSISPVKLEADKVAELIGLRTRVIALLLKRARINKNISLETLAADCGLELKDLESFENAKTPVSLPVLERLCARLDLQVAELFSSISIKQDETTAPAPETTSKEAPLPSELHEFFVNQANLPYLELAKKLSELDAAKLRNIAESLLEITY